MNLGTATTMPLSVLFLEDDEADATLVDIQLRRLDWVDTDVHHVRSLRAARDLLKERDFGLIIADLHVADSHGVATIRNLILDVPAPPIIAHTGNIELAEQAIMAGADAYVIKGLGPERLEEALRNSIARARSGGALRSVIDGNMDAMVVVEATDHVVLFANVACATVLGREPSELVGEVFSYQSKERSVVELELQRDGETRSAEMRTRPIVWHGRSALLNCVRDTTDRTRAREYEQRLVHANRLAAIGQLAAGVAHEVNNPAAFILANLEHIQDHLREIRESIGDSSPTLHHLLDDCGEMVSDSLAGTRRIATIVKDLRSFARTETDELEMVDLNSLVRLACRMAMNEIRHRASLVTSLEALPLIPAHHAELSQVVLNLLINAAQAIDRGGPEANRIRLSTVFRDGEIILSVEDTGHGIAPHNLAKVFDPFFTTKERDVGTGLGLALCAETVRKHRGTITAASKEGKGTCFTVTLPTETDLRPSRVQTDARMVQPLSRARARVLIVDDDRMVRRAFLRVIGDKHEAVEAQGGEEGLAHLSRLEPFDVIICDLMMPGLDGPAFYAAATEMDPSLQDLFVFVSGGAFSPSTRRFLKETNATVLEKPVSRDALLEIIGRSRRR